MLLRPRIFIAATCTALAALGAGCASEFPSRDDFVSTSKASISQDLIDRLSDAKIAPDAANTLIDDYLGCIYDAISSDDGLIERFVSDPSAQSTQTEIESRSAGCESQANQGILDAIIESTK